MKIKFNQFSHLNFTVKTERNILFNQVRTMRQRHFGLVNIIDVAPQKSEFQASKLCAPALKKSSEIDTRKIFSIVMINLMDVCARTMVVF